MKGLLFTLLVSLNFSFSYSQFSGSGIFAYENFADSVLKQIQQTSADTNKVKLLNTLGDYYSLIRQDSSIFYLIQSIELAEKINDLSGSYTAYNRMAFVLNSAGNYGKALEMALKGLKVAEKLKSRRELSMAGSYQYMALINLRNNFDTIAFIEAQQSIRLFEKEGVNQDILSWGPYGIVAAVYLKWNKFDSALYYAQKAYDISLHSPPRGQVNLSVTATYLANIYLKLGRVALARQYFFRGIATDKKFNAPLLTVRIYNNFARFFKTIGQLDSCIYYAEMAFQLCRNHQFGEQATDAANLVAQSYELLRMPDSALKYTKIFIAAKDTIFNQSKLLQIQLLNFDEGQRQKDIQRAIEQAQERYTNRVRYYTLIATAVIFLLLSVILYRNNRNKRMANIALESQKEEIDQQRTKAENTLHELRSTQKQLIQSEKMASLGELTAGIAHEIQNPLNFMNNFSEVNKELIEEMKQELAEGNLPAATVIANNIQQNEDKINHHGKRADAIVKGMLQHSQSSAGKKEPTDINALTDEYLRLAYHGYRAKEKSFNVTMKTNYDESIGKINVIPQDMGRVLLNLFNNAFYAVSDKKKQLSGGYEPAVSVNTKKINDKVEIRIMDNGNGVPQKVMDKIFHPFFTTKPTGQGTGLGLSISYDIIKAHGGELKVETKEGEGARFVVQIPLV